VKALTKVKRPGRAGLERARQRFGKEPVVQRSLGDALDEVDERSQGRALTPAERVLLGKLRKYAEGDDRVLIDELLGTIGLRR